MSTRIFAGFLAAIITLSSASAQKQRWVDSVFQTLTDEERIAQLIVIRTSSMDAAGNPVIFDSLVSNSVKKYNVGAVCLFQGNPLQQAALLNNIQQWAKTPVMVTVDGEWGLGMRFAGVKSFPYQLTMGAVSDATVVYQVGRAIAEQCRRMNIHVNYAPVVDINNNAANPVIGLRSFGENKYKVALMGARMMEGLQDGGIMACAKHFPGHGDVSVDSHYDLPVINKSRDVLDNLELYPFRDLVAKGIGSMMVAHLSVPSLDSSANRPTSLSKQTISGLLRHEMGFGGLIFTDALEMKGVAKFYPNGDAGVESIIAGNDMMCLPASVPGTIQKMKAAIAQKRLTWEQVYEKCRRVLAAKYDYVVGRTGKVETNQLTEQLNRQVDSLRGTVAKAALTVVKGAATHMPLSASEKTAYVVLSPNAGNHLSRRMAKLKADVFYLPSKNSSKTAADSILRKLLAGRYQRTIVSLHGLARNPANHFGISDTAIDLIRRIGDTVKGGSLLLFGNPYAMAWFEKSGYDYKVVCYEDDSVFQETGMEWLQGRFAAAGTLPVSVGSFAAGHGITGGRAFVQASPETVGMNSAMLQAIDTVATEAIRQGAAPGCVVLVLKNGKMVFEKAYGYLSYDSAMPVSPATIYDLASVTKISATTVAVMKLYEEGKLDLKAPLGKYLPELKGAGKEGLLIENLLLHQAGLVSFIPFFRELTDPASGQASRDWFSNGKNNQFSIPVTGTMFMRRSWNDTMFSRIAGSVLNQKELKYVYSDNDFIYLGKVVEALSGMSLHEYVQHHFYGPLGMQSTGFRSYERFPNNLVAPTEQEKTFRQQLVWNYVHDPGAAMFGNVAGHAGLFSNAADLAILYQMLLNGGRFNGKTFLKKETIDWFTAYQTPISRRGLGFDKPEKNNALRTEKTYYPARYVSPATYGHTGFTGTCVWVDPAHELVYIFLSNRVHPEGGDNKKLADLNIRARIQDIIYQSIITPGNGNATAL